MTARNDPRRLTRTETIIVVSVPWLFVIVFAALLMFALVPAALAGHAVAIIVGVLAASAFVSFVVAAVTLSRDAMAGRWPT